MNTIFYSLVLGLTRPEIEPESPAAVADARPLIGKVKNLLTK